MILLLATTAWLLALVLVLSLCAAAARGDDVVADAPPADPVREARFSRDGAREAPSMAQARR